MAAGAAAANLGAGGVGSALLALGSSYKVLASYAQQVSQTISQFAVYTTTPISSGLVACTGAPLLFLVSFSITGGISSVAIAVGVGVDAAAPRHETDTTIFDLSGGPDINLVSFSDYLSHDDFTDVSPGNHTFAVKVFLNTESTCRIYNGAHSRLTVLELRT
jgi:hypothetical protein